jgi:hypothetical protein
MTVLKGDELARLAKAVDSRAAFLSFLTDLRANCRTHKQEWENADLDQFIKGMIGFTRDMDGYYRSYAADVDTNQPSWRLMAEILLAAKVYE